jgi:hypothetical protein
LGLNSEAFSFFWKNPMRLWFLLSQLREMLLDPNPGASQHETREQEREPSEGEVCVLYRASIHRSWPVYK